MAGVRRVRCVCVCVGGQGEPSMGWWRWGGRMGHAGDGEAPHQPPGSPHFTLRAMTPTRPPPPPPPPPPPQHTHMTNTPDAQANIQLHRAVLEEDVAVASQPVRVGVVVWGGIVCGWGGEWGGGGPPLWGAHPRPPARPAPPRLIWAPGWASLLGSTRSTASVGGQGGTTTAKAASEASGSAQAPVAAACTSSTFLSVVRRWA